MNTKSKTAAKTAPAKAPISKKLEKKLYPEVPTPAQVAAGVVAAPAPKVEAPAPKATKPPKHDPAAKLTVLVSTNPKREGTKAHARFALYAGCKTVGEFMAKGGTASDIEWNRKRKFIALG